MARRKGGAGAEVYRHVREGPGKGLRVGTAASRHEDTIRAVDFHAKGMGREAHAILARHHDAGDAYIEVKGGSAAEGSNPRYRKIERVVILNDTRGFGAAMTIEFGMGPGIDDEGYFYPGTEAIAPLRRAAGLDWVRHRQGAPTPRLPNRRSRRWKIGGL